MDTNRYLQRLIGIGSIMLLGMVATYWHLRQPLANQEEVLTQRNAPAQWDKLTQEYRQKTQQVQEAITKLAPQAQRLTWAASREQCFKLLQSHFAALPTLRDWQCQESVVPIVPAVTKTKGPEKKGRPQPDLNRLAKMSDRLVATVSFQFAYEHLPRCATLAGELAHWGTLERKFTSQGESDRLRAELRYEFAPLLLATTYASTPETKPEAPQAFPASPFRQPAPVVRRLTEADVAGWHLLQILYNPQGPSFALFKPDRLVMAGDEVGSVFVNEICQDRVVLGEYGEIVLPLNK